VLPTHLHAAVIEHTRLGAHLLGETDGVSHTILATALAEALLLAGRIEFFDLRQPDDADATFVRSRQREKPTTSSAPSSSAIWPPSPGFGTGQEDGGRAGQSRREG
jgi:hypothetical protein